MRATSLKGKHVETLLQRWQGEGLSAGTLKMRGVEKTTTHAARKIGIFGDVGGWNETGR